MTMARNGSCLSNIIFSLTVFNLIFFRMNRLVRFKFYLPRSSRSALNKLKTALGFDDNTIFLSFNNKHSVNSEHEEY